MKEYFKLPQDPQQWMLRFEKEKIVHEKSDRFGTVHVWKKNLRYEFGQLHSKARNGYERFISDSKSTDPEGLISLHLGILKPRGENQDVLSFNYYENNYRVLPTGERQYDPEPRIDAEINSTVQDKRIIFKYKNNKLHKIELNKMFKEALEENSSKNVGEKLTDLYDAYKFLGLRTFWPELSKSSDATEELLTSIFEVEFIESTRTWSVEKKDSFRGDISNFVKELVKKHIGEKVEDEFVRTLSLLTLSIIRDDEDSLDSKSIFLGLNLSRNAIDFALAHLKDYLGRVDEDIFLVLNRDDTITAGISQLTKNNVTILDERIENGEEFKFDKYAYLVNFTQDRISLQIKNLLGQGEHQIAISVPRTLDFEKLLKAFSADDPDKWQSEIKNLNIEGLF